MSGQDWTLTFFASPSNPLLSQHPSSPCPSDLQTPGYSLVNMNVSLFHKTLLSNNATRTQMWTSVAREGVGKKKELNKKTDQHLNDKQSKIPERMMIMCTCIKTCYILFQENIVH